VILTGATAAFGRHWRNGARGHGGEAWAWEFGLGKAEKNEFSSEGA